jgi:hypothetical protein
MVAKVELVQRWHYYIPGGRDPHAHAMLEGCCSIHLSYGRVLVPNNPC